MKTKRFICLLLALVMCLSVMPVTALAVEGTPGNPAPNGHLSSIAWNRSTKDTNQLYLKSDSPPYETFGFDPNVTEYEIMLVDAADVKVDSGVYIIATLDEDTPINDTLTDPEKSFPMIGRFTDSSDELISKSGRNYDQDTRQYKMPIGGFLNFADNVKMNSDPYKVKFVTGYLTAGTVNQPQAVLSNTETYTFNFYRKATLAGFAAAYENGAAITEGIPSVFDPYLNDYEITGVTAGTDKLVVTAPAYTQTDTTLKFDDGSGEFTEGTNFTYTLDLANYNKEQYKQEDGSLIIPFVLDYTGSGSGVDGHYTLKISFAEEEVDYTPVFTSVSEDAKVKVGDDLTLSVAVKALDSETESSLSYQWYSSDSDTSEGDPISGAAETAYKPATTSTGITYYTCEATRTVEGAEYSANTEPIKVTVEEDSHGDIYTPVFTSVSEDANVKVGDDLTLSVAVEALDSDTSSSLSYQWYSSDSAGSKGAEIPGAAEAAYNPATTSAGITYYTCEATRTVEGAEYHANTEPIKVTVEEDSPGDIYTPVFTSVSEDANVKVGDDLTLSVAVEALDSNTESSLSYQWYSSDSDTSEGDPISGAAEAAYKPATTSAGITYYTCEATRTVEGAEYSANTEPIKVTVEEDSPGNIDGFVKNITFKTHAGDYVFFDQFEPEQTYYVPVPLNGSSFSVFYDVLVELDNPDLDHIKTLTYSLSLKSSDGTITRFKEALSGGFYNSATLEVTDVTYGNIGSGMGSTRYGIFDRLEIGEYVFEINVHERGNPEAGNVYKFTIILLPGADRLAASAGGKILPVTTAVSQSGINATFVREYDTAIPAGTDEITLKGALRAGDIVSDPAEGAKFIYNGEDKTADFTGAGVTIDLTKYIKDSNGVYTVPFSAVYGETGSKYRSDYKLYVTAVDAADWEITTQPQGGTYDKGDKAELSVQITPDNPDVTYQWLWGSNPDSLTNVVDEITGADEPTYTAYTGNGGTRYYRCLITDNKTGAHAYSEIAEVAVNLGTVNAPIILYQPGIYNYESKALDYKTEYLQGEPIDPIQIVAGTTEQFTREVQHSIVNIVFEWYYNTKESTDGAVPLSTNAGSTYQKGHRFSIPDYNGIADNAFFGVSYGCDAPDNLSVGDHYFYCVVSAVSTADPNNKISVQSDFGRITVKEREELDGFEGKGSEDNPYLIETVDHLKKIDEYVLSGDFLAGAVFQFANDITLPADWEPIGENPKSDGGISLQPFSGIIDGGGHTLTVAKGGKPMLEYARDAAVRNLNIFGEEINGAGLLDEVTVDYGLDGAYDYQDDPDVITMENVKLLSGSKTRGSGLANGGYNSGVNDITVKNCIIQENVTVGYDKAQSDIGSFVGTLNGRIENSVSYASVYGVRNVGGLAGKKGQSMGNCEIVNSAFVGEVEATGGNVGGILGAGYIASSAPNTPPVTIRNCYADANITRNSSSNIGAEAFDTGSGIGGILGSEIGLLAAWNRAYISDNHFYGEITDTAGGYARVGGILGEIGGYNPVVLVYENNYYLENDSYGGIGYLLRPNNDWKPNEDSFIAKSSEEFADGTVLNLLMEGKNSFKNWMQEENAHYPVHDPNAKPRVYALEISGDYKIIYYVGEELDTAGMKLTALYTITGDKVEVDLKDAEFSGYDPNIVGNQDVTVTYEGASAAFTVSVIRKYDPGDPIGDTISVKFALIGSTRSDGDIDLGNEDLLYRGASYVRWIGLTEYEMAEGATVLELFDRALKEAGISYTIRSMNNYVDSIRGLAEFTNGPRSGWMYTVGKKNNGSDGSHPNLGLREYVLSDGEVIIWHYVNDYSYEVHDWFDEPGYPSLGDGTYYSLWLKALASGSYTPPSGGGVTDSGTVLNPKVKAQNGIAAVSVTADELSKAIAGVKKNGGTAIVIAPEITGTAKKVTVDIPKSSLASMSSDTKADLKIVTPNGSVAIPNDALASVASQAGGNTVTIVVESVDPKALTDEQQKLVGDNAVFDISILSGDKPIGSFGGKSITISLPYTLKTGETADGVTVWYLGDGGKLERMTCKYDKTTGLVTFTTTHLSSYVVGYAAESVWENPFTDVKDGDWFYKAVRYAVENELFNGTSETTFSPNTDMTRAMLVTVLYRLESEPAVTGTNSFTDVKDGEWYTDAVIWANANGIVTGYGDGLFGTNDPITREQMAVILYNYAKHKGYDVTKTASLESYTDASDISGWAADAMKWVNVEEIITGRTATTLAPGGNATRAEVAAIMQRFILDFED